MTTTPAPKGADIDPCPFCGGAAKVEEKDIRGRVIECEDCGASVGGHDLPRGIAMWNRRAGSSTSTSQGAPVDAHKCTATGVDSQNRAEVDGNSGAAPGDALDAARYRWLIQEFGETKFPVALERLFELKYGACYVADYKEGIDAAIDERMPKISVSAIAASTAGDA